MLQENLSAKVACTVFFDKKTDRSCVFLGFKDDKTPDLYNQKAYDR